MWQAQYLVTLEGHACCSAQCINDVLFAMRINHASDFFVVGAVFGDVGRWLLLLCAL